MSKLSARSKIITVNRNRKDNQLDVVNRADVSRQIDLDLPTNTLAGAETEIRPPYGFGTLNALFLKSNILRQCVDAMVTNIAGFGMRVVPLSPDVPIDPEEKATLQSWIFRANVDRSLPQENRKQIFEFEKYGIRYMEVVRDSKQQPSLLRHVPVSSLRQLSKQNKYVSVTRFIDRGGKRAKITERKRFRKYRQQLGSKYIYFKEWGDPRTMDYRDGKYQTPKSGRIAARYQATEIMHNKQDSEDIYGTPRWISMTPVILGSREAEEVNLRYFEDNMIPASIITISGGRLTTDSFQEVRAVIEAGGASKQNQLMLLEAIPETGGIDEKGSVKIEIEKMASERPSDGLFSEYDKANQDKIRSTFRLPPVILGSSQSISFSTAHVSAFVAEVQVFQPQRMFHDDWFNNSFVNHVEGLNLKTVKVESKGPPLTDPTEVVKALVAANQMGAITPRKSIDLINEQMQISIDQYPVKGEEGYEDWMDQPLQLSIRELGQNPDPFASETHEESGAKTEEIDESEAGNNIANVGTRGRI